MKYRGHDAQRDANEPAIVEALRKAGATVVLLNQPLDLLVGFRGVNYLIEVKLPKGPRGGSSHSNLTFDQVVFIMDWHGDHDIVRTPEEALEAIGVLVPQGRDCTR